MEEQFQIFQNLKENHLIHTINPYFNEIFYEFSFFLFSNENSHQSLKNIKNQTFLVADLIKYSENKYLIIGFERTLILVDTKNVEQMKIFFEMNKDTIIFIFKEETPNIIEEQLDDKEYFKFGQMKPEYNDEIKTLQKEFLIKNRTIMTIWKIFTRSIAFILIIEGYQNSFTDRIIYMENIIEETPKYLEMNDKEFIKISTINITETSIIEKIYHLKERKIFIIKKKRRTLERNKLNEREFSNYEKVHHPLLLQLYYEYEGEIQIKSNNHPDRIILEFINGTTLENIEKQNLSSQDKMKIIFEIMLIINYLHGEGFIYRDLKPNNLILDENQTVILIDLDRMIKYNEDLIEEERTIIIHPYSSPEIKEGQTFSYSTDIYSLGMLIYYIIFEEEPSLPKIERRLFQQENKYKSIVELINKCTNKEPNERPNIKELIKYFYKNI